MTLEAVQRKRCAISSWVSASDCATGKRSVTAPPVTLSAEPPSAPMRNVAVCVASRVLAIRPSAATTVRRLAVNLASHVERRLKALIFRFGSTFLVGVPFAPVGSTSFRPSPLVFSRKKAGFFFMFLVGALTTTQTPTTKKLLQRCLQSSLSGLRAASLLTNLRR